MGVTGVIELDKGYKYLFIKLKAKHNGTLERRLRLFHEGGIKGEVGI